MSKKFIMFVSTILLMVFSVLIACSCINYDDITKDFETDGYLYYYDGGEGDKYFVCGNTDKELPKVFQIPSHFNGKIVYQVGFIQQRGMFSKKYYHPILLNADKLYLPYTCQLEKGIHDVMINHIGPEKLYYINNTILHYDIYKNFDNNVIFYFTYDVFDEVRKVYAKSVRFENINMYKGKFIDKETIIQIANTVYKFNYDGSPNDNIFFIDDYDGGEKLTAPWETPIREGYTFNGWYKEAECINKWDFENDVMPEFRYNENDERIFEITYLYAKWDKN